MAIKVKNGDFIVMRDRWRTVAVQAIKITAQFVFYRDKTWGDRERRVRLDDVLFSGPQIVADRLVAQLESSEALADQESRASHDRKIARDDKYIQGAGAALTQDERK